MGKVSSASLEERQRVLLAEIDAALDRYQPELKAKLGDECVLVEGTLKTTGPAGPFDSFKVGIAVTDGFPIEEPYVWETDGRIERIVNSHVFPDPGNCCLGVWEEWLIQADDHSFASFLNGPLHSFFVSQSEFEVSEKWPFDDRSHGRKGILEAYSDILKIDKDESKIMGYLAILCLKRLKGHHICPCGSGKRLRDCHIEQFERLRLKIPIGIAERMARKLR